MSACNACYAASTEPAWIAQLVIQNRIDRPCDVHRPALSDPEPPRRSDELHER